MIKPQKFISRLGFIQKISSKVYLKRFDLVEPAEIDFLPGQTIMFQVAPGVNRSMSIASAPAEKTSILVAHDVSPMGPYSQWTIRAKAGDPMHFIGPLGVFYLDRESARKRVFIATGTGVSPFRSMLFEQLSSNNELNVEYTNKTPTSRAASLANENLDPSSEKLVSRSFDTRTPKSEDGQNFVGSTQPFSLYWGLRREEDIFWKEEFEALAAKYPNFKFVLTLSQPSDSWQGKRGRVGDYVFIEEKNLTDCDFYLCGNRAMVSEIETALLAKNVPKGQIKKELFY